MATSILGVSRTARFLAASPWKSCRCRRVVAAPCANRVDPRMGGDPGPPRGISLRAAHRVVPKEFSPKTRRAGEKPRCFCFLLFCCWFGLGFFCLFICFLTRTTLDFQRFSPARRCARRRSEGSARCSPCCHLFFFRRSCTVARGDAAFRSHGIFGLTAVRSSSPLGTRVSLVSVGTRLRCKSLGRSDRSPAENELCREWQGWSLPPK